MCLSALSDVILSLFLSFPIYPSTDLPRGIPGTLPSDREDRHFLLHREGVAIHIREVCPPQYLHW